MGRLAVGAGAVCAALAAVAAAPARPTRAEFERAVRPVLERVSAEFNMSFQVGYADGHGGGVGWGLAAGLDNRFTKTALGDGTPIPAGSVTKTWTGVAVLQAVARGDLTLDTPVHVWADPPLRAQNGTTMAELWGHEAEVDRVTIRDLLGHTSGFADYDDAALRFWTLTEGEQKSFTPFDFLAVADKALTCPHAPCPPFYSSINFVLLGLIAQHLSGRAAWEDFDQLGVIPAGRRHLYDQTVFPKLGPCSRYPVSHQLAVATVPSPAGLPGANATVFHDVMHLSCLNGWTTGNIAASARDLAMFYRDLLSEPAAGGVASALAGADQAARHSADAAHHEQGGAKDASSAAQLLPPHLVSEMTSWRNLTNTWTEGWGELGIFYGLALFHSGEFARLAVPGTGDGAATTLLGHPGGDYGSSSSPVCGYNRAFGFGLCVLMPSAQGMNCSSEEALALSYSAGSLGSCLVYAEVLKLHGGPWLDCYQYKPALGLNRRRHRNEHGTNNNRTDAATAKAPPPNASRVAPRADAASAEAARCEWLPSLPLCDTCRSAVCEDCATCAGDRRHARCRPCWEGFAPCLPRCSDAGCFPRV